jgi:hypothetical protein
MMKKQFLNKFRGTRKALSFVILTVVAGLCGGANFAAQEKSKGVYRIPYENGVKVEVTNDFFKHKPLGRIDMHGEGGGPYKIVAAADGVIKHIVDNFSAQVDSSSGAPCTNNYVWIEHANGEWTKYSHMQKDSTTKKAKLKVGQFVKAGTYLGDEGAVGCASGSHLHFEVGVPNLSDPITVTGGFLKDNGDSKRNRIPRICGISGGAFASGKTYEARDVPGNLKPGAAEIARHGLADEDYQCQFDQAVNAGYKLDWIDAFNFKGQVYFNVIFRPSKGEQETAFHGLDGAEYQDEFDKRKSQGYRLKQIESYLSGNKILYAGIFAKDGVTPAAYHGLSADEHQARFDDLTKKGWIPKNISVVSRSGNRIYAALYEKGAADFESKSFLTPDEYQKEADDNKAKGRQLVYLNGYQHNGQPRLAAIWRAGVTGAFKARHDLSGDAYQDEYEDARKNGLLTRAVTGYPDGNTARYAAVWRK